MTVEHVRVGDVLRLVRQPVTPKPEQTYTSIGIRSFGKGIFQYEPKPGSELGSLRFFCVEPGRLLLSNIKGWEGAIAVSTSEQAGCIASNRFLPYEPVDHRIDVNWARWFLLSERGLELVGQASPGSADRNRTLAIERFEALEIPLPPVDEQRRIAAGMDRIAISRLRAGVLRSRSVAQLAALSAGFVSRPEDTSTGWREVLLGDILAESQVQVVVEPAERYRMAGVYSFGRGFIERGSILGEETSYRKLTRLGLGDFVVTKLNGWEGGVAVVDEDFQGAYVSGEYPTFHPDLGQVVPGFLAGVARAPWFWQQLEVSTKGSMVRRRRVSAAQVLDTRIWIPGLDEQVQIARRLQALRGLAQRMEKAESRLDAIPSSVSNASFGHLQ